MFEAQQEAERARSKWVWVVVPLIGILIAAGVLYYMRSGTKLTPQAITAARTAAAGKSDPVKDLKISDPKVDKDYTGTAAMCAVTIENKSDTFTYSDIAYETTYMSADNQVLAENQGKLDLSITPGAQRTAQFRDALFPPGTAYFKFRVTGATGTVE
jgi:hypothetical protein